MNTVAWIFTHALRGGWGNLGWLIMVIASGALIIGVLKFLDAKRRRKWRE